MNRIAVAIKQMKAKVDALSDAKLAKMSANAMADTDHEVFVYQNHQALAHAGMKITADEARTLYSIYGGESPCKASFNKQSLPRRIVGLMVAVELLGERVGRG